jgi:two-component system LytT family sensor kinase
MKKVMRRFVDKLYHIPFWLLYHYLWWAVAMGNPFRAASSIMYTPYAIKFGFYVAFQAFAAYFNLYYLIPNYLQKSKFRSYLVFFVISQLCTALAIVAGYYVSAWATHISIETLYGQGSNCFFYFFGEALPSTLASTTLAMSIKLARNWVRSEQRKQLLEKEKLQAELHFLKHQFNPHFLFNSINSIFFMIHKNPDMASASLARFSELLRHQLYECNDQQIGLEKEIGYLRNFIDLEKLRQHKHLRVDVEIDLVEKNEPVIAPFVLMTFVENAFKHVSKGSTTDNWIHIRLHLIRNQLQFDISNSTSPEQVHDLPASGGIGLAHVERRLALVYPEKHSIKIENEPDHFKVSLQIELDEMSRSLQRNPTMNHLEF